MKKAKAPRPAPWNGKCFVCDGPTHGQKVTAHAHRDQADCDRYFALKKNEILAKLLEGRPVE